MNPGIFPGVARPGGQPLLDVPSSLGAARTYSTTVLSGQFHSPTASTSSTALVEALNVSRAGVIEWLAHTNSGPGTGVYVEVWIDGALVYSSTAPVVNGATAPIVGAMMEGASYQFISSLGAVPFRKSVVVKHKVATGTSIVSYRYRTTK